MKSIIALIRENRALSLAFLAVFLFCVGIYLYTRWDTARFEASLQTPPQETHSTEPNAKPPEPTQTEHFHPEPHAPAQGRDTMPPDSEAPPPLTHSELPDALPYPMTLENRHIWKALLTEATTDPVLMEKLIPDTEEKIYVLLRNLSNSVNSQIDRKVSLAAYRKLHAINPNDWRMLKTLAGLACLPFQTRADRLEYTRYMEQAKALANAQGVQMTTPFLSFAYRDLGMLEKAVAEGFEQWELLEKLTRERKTNGSNQVGLMHIGDVLFLEEQLEKQHQSQKNQ